MYCTRSLKTLSAAALAAALASAPARAELPETAELHYSASFGIPAEMTFSQNGSEYRIVAKIHVPLYKMRFEAGGTVENGSLKPRYYRDTRNGKTYAEARFGNGQVSLGRGSTVHTEKTSGNVMDLFSLSWQLAGSGGRLPENLSVTNGKKLYPLGGIRPAGSGSLKIGGSRTTVDKFVLRREADSVSYAFAPAIGNVPALIGYNVGGKRYSLTLKSAVVNGEKIQPE